MSNRIVTNEITSREVRPGEVSLERMVRAVERVRERLIKTAQALEQAGVPYAVTGGNAVAAHVSRVDESAVRNTQDVDILIERDHLEAAIIAMESAGFHYRHVRGIDLFLDGPEAKAREAVHIVFAGEKVRDDYPFAAAKLDEAEQGDQFHVISLEALVRMKLTSFRLKDQVHLQDMLEVGLIDAGWLDRLAEPLSERLQTVIDSLDEF
ncbi:hypothetical protein [Calycomorphotria hydatis]|uniref:Uncharacterized protein n=1 Tax=Calycomorphotria hydatis TaxID=2528027 RepID=A0A517T4D4_9PLAN|nr:hypothetical protein [Calycomorphotria hydatis]QDT63236.1 hypothetical protein V22_04550 [Calycomorphotria hydatis]